MSSSRSLRSSISPFRSRRPPSSSSASSTTAKRPTTLSSRPSTAPPSKSSLSPSTLSSDHQPDSGGKATESVTVTVRFRPLSAREINKGDEIAWYADGDYTVRNEYNPDTAYGFDRVFGPATTTRRVFDVAAQHVVNGAMGGINGTVFAYGVTSSGKTHTMHGEQKSPGIIPLAIKDVFGIIQETPGREFLLRVSYLEIYNEVINDLLDPTGQNLRVREDAQGTYVEGIKEEVVLSPAHALSLIASGEEHRHVGSNNFNLLSSRSHTIFTLTIESSPRGENQGEEVTLSQLHLIDLAGSESSKTETTGLRRKEGSYINKSLLTLGTVISKLTDGKATHIPYRDSKLTRLLQSSLSGHGRVSLICTVTPASSNTEETHNTLKFAHRSKHVEIKASQNKILDEKSLIKKYQKEISNLKQELEQLKRGMMENQNVAPVQEDLVNLKLQLEAGKVKLQSRLEEEEQAKAALMGRIQRLTKLILVSTKSTIQSNVREKPGHRRRHSFGEDELAYLPDRKRECMIDDDIGSINSEVSADGRVDVTDLDELVKDYKRNRRRGMLGWFKLKKPDSLVVSSSSADYENSANSSPSTSSKSSQGRVTFGATKDGQRKSVSKRREIAFSADFLPEITQAGDLFSAAIGGRQLPATGTTIADQIDLLREQVKMLAGEVALCISSLKRVSEQAAKNPEDLHLQEQMQRLKDEIREKKLQINILEQRMIGSVEMTPKASSNIEMSQALSKLASQLNEKTFELEIKSADNRVLQEQLKMKVSENAKMQETILLLRQQLDAVLSDRNSKFLQQSSENEDTSEICSNGYMEAKTLRKDGTCLDSETITNENTPASSVSLDEKFMHEDTKVCRDFAVLNSKLLMQAAEIESLKQEKVKSTEEKDGLEIQCQKLAEEALYAKELAAAAAVELRSLAEEVTKLSYQNAKLTAGKDACQRFASFGTKQINNDSSRANAHLRKPQDGISMEELEQELNVRYQREASLVGALSERDKIEAELRRRLDEAKRHEADLENELANMWVAVAKTRKSGTDCRNPLEEYDASKIPQPRSASEFSPSNGHACSESNENEIYDNGDVGFTPEVSKACCHLERQRCKELENFVSRLKGDDLGGLDMKELEELQNLHVDAITKICYAKCSTDVL
ncbi:PREDICTED: LOW QUALITY PROTEIN: kinesin-like protein KIN-7C, mitochondrial [Ipomoea nil]|uniref:LOW QUALITY PROTEIN: kinesin-like protein KIN-7C, mitochondrial n=1 Tax=Ipomoea nil TaxID=35883 RepID=UPI000901349C|nr:PREDICTED: LOW QUALITY PROTEIN: kinesin-like protein KIN-7C, mitochondrial [Ipomoea nil]